MAIDDNILDPKVLGIRINSRQYGPGIIVSLSEKYGSLYAEILFDDLNVPSKKYDLIIALKKDTITILNADEYPKLYDFINKYAREESPYEKEKTSARGKKPGAKEKFYDSIRERQIKQYDETKTLVDELWQKLCDTSKDFTFLGFHHHACFETFLKICESGYLKSRNEAMNTGIVDVADAGVMEHTNEEIKNYARMYFGPKTPTYYNNEGIKFNTYGAGHGNVPIPVALIFGKSVLEEMKCEFSEGNAGSEYSRRTESYKTALQFDWKTILSRDRHDMGNKYITRLRDGELLIRDKVSLKHLIMIAFRTEADKKHAEYFLGGSDLFQVLPEMFKSPDEIRYNYSATGEKYYKNTYLVDYNIRRAKEEMKIDFEFIRPVEGYIHELKKYMKNGAVKTERVNAFGISGTLSIVDDFNEIDHFEYLLNGNVSAIWR